MESAVSNNLKNTIRMIDHIIRYKYDINIKLRDDISNSHISSDPINNMVARLLDTRYEYAVAFRKLSYKSEDMKNDLIEMIEMVNEELKKLIFV